MLTGAKKTYHKKPTDYVKISSALKNSVFSVEFYR